LRISKNDLFKVPSRANLLKEKLPIVKIGALFLVEKLFTGKKKNKKTKKINIIVKPQASSLRSESEKRRGQRGQVGQRWWKYVHRPFGPRTGEYIIIIITF
jgi:hypothetical protein